MLLPIQTAMNPQSDIVSQAFSVAFSNYLLLHHAIHEERLNKKSFEYIFKYSCEAAGRDVRLNFHSIDSAEDMAVDGIKFSLKTQADAAIKPGAIYIQKLMEARWIRECVTAEDFARETRNRVTDHLGGYEKILVLRAFEPDPDHVKYELVEIPRDLLLRVRGLSAADFGARNKYGSSGADVTDKRGRAFRILLDGSVEKVRIFNLRTDRCVVHATWTIQRPAPKLPKGSSEET